MYCLGIMEVRPAKPLFMRLAAIIVALALSGCQGLSLPRIDPTGEHLFVPGPVTFKPEPGAPAYYHKVSVSVQPNRIIAPVNSEVLLTAGVCGPDGTLRANERVDWSVDSAGVGHVVDVGKREFLQWFTNLPNFPRKIDNQYAIGNTSGRYVVLTRGTPDPGDDVRVLRGQSWVSVTSPVEGTSYVTAFAPQVYGWEARRQTATIEWIDAQWTFPPPAINPAGSRHVFTTAVARQSNQVPLPEYLVRYEILAGPEAGFAPDGGKSIEVTTDQAGQASAEIFQIQPAPGTNRIRITVLRNVITSGNVTQPIIVGNGETIATWTGPQIAVRKQGPAQAEVGEILSFRLEVTNNGQALARNVMIVEALEPPYQYVDSSPAATMNQNRLEWRLGDLPVGETRAVDLRVRADRPGTVQNCADAFADGIRARGCVTTTILPRGGSDISTPETPPVRPTPSNITVRMTGPGEAAVGDTVTFDIEVTNRGNTRLSNLLLVDRFDRGLQHSEFRDNLELTLDPIEPGQTITESVELTVLEPGQWCNSVEVIQGRRSLATDQACINANGRAGGSDTKGAPRAARIVVKKSGPVRASVGERVTFTIEVKNDGNAAARNLEIRDEFDARLNPIQATQGYNADADSVAWNLAELPAGETETYQIEFECAQAARGVCNSVVVTASGGIREESEACLDIVPGTANLSVSLTDASDPVAVGRESAYEVRITNRGRSMDRNVVVEFEFPEQVSPVKVGSSGPAQFAIDGQSVRFEPVEQIGPGETLTYRIAVRMASEGEVTIRANVTSDLARTPVVAEQQTAIFSNE